MSCLGSIYQTKRFDWTDSRTFVQHGRLQVVKANLFGIRLFHFEIDLLQTKSMNFGHSNRDRRSTDKDWATMTKRVAQKILKELGKRTFRSKNERRGEKENISKMWSILQSTWLKSSSNNFDQHGTKWLALKKIEQHWKGIRNSMIKIDACNGEKAIFFFLVHWTKIAFDWIEGNRRKITFSIMPIKRTFAYHTLLTFFLWLLVQEII